MVAEDYLKNIIKWYPWLFLLIVILIIVLNGSYQIWSSRFIPEPGKTIYIAPGTSLKTMGDILEKEGIIGSSFYFRVYLWLTGKHKEIKAGFHTFKGIINLQTATNQLTTGGQGIFLTFPEGLTLMEIESILKRNGLKADFKKWRLKDFPEVDLAKYFPPEATLEGFLAPDSYQFFKEEGEREIILKFLKNFSKKFLPEFLKQPGTNFYQKLILASLLEKEAKTNEDKALIAGILEKRLKAGKKLEVDASIAYIRCQIYPCDWNVSKDDLKIASPYNTYLNLGYPPTPISNPGVETIKSALNPVESNFWYYLTNKEGKVIFAQTLKEHQNNIKKYLK